MKIERISDNQIKFLLTENDLSERNMRLHELQYNNEKTQELFREVMERANVECGFHTTSETPLIIEAIPVPRDGIMIIVTKIAGNGEELDERFGYPPVLGNYRNAAARAKNKKKLHEMSEFLRQNTPEMPQSTHPRQIIFEFASLDNVTKACGRVHGTYIGNNALYKFKGKYYLIVENDRFMLSPGQENILKEYSNRFSDMDISKMFLMEHGEVVIEDNAIGVLSAFLS